MDNENLVITELRERIAEYERRIARHRRTDDLLKILLPIGLALSSERNFDRLSEVILSEALRLCNADGGTLYVKTPDNKLQFTIAHTHSLDFTLGGTSGHSVPFDPLPLYDANGRPDRQHIAARAAIDGAVINIPDVYTSPYDFSGARTFDQRNGYRTRSMLVVPMKNNQGELIGVLQMINAQDSITSKVIPFDGELQGMIELLASLAAVALDNHRLVEEQAANAILRHDLQVGQEIQRTFLPVQLPNPAGWQIDSRFAPARQVAGDFYDAFLLPNARIGLVIADVSDKGVAAALLMAIARTLVRAFAEHTGDDFTTLETVSRTNDYMIEHHSESCYFATLFFGVLHLDTGALAYINAGHNPPYIVTPDQRIRTILKPSGPSIGMLKTARFGIVEETLGAHETLFCYTDGLPEARDPQGEFFSESRLRAEVEAPADSVYTLLNRVERTLHHHIGSAAPFDDMTMLAIRREGV
jgi:sigma-B regulation protein RsbU (phosphoserine phosphatase)